MLDRSIWDEERCHEMGVRDVDVHPTVIDERTGHTSMFFSTLTFILENGDRKKIMIGIPNAEAVELAAKLREEIKKMKQKEVKKYD